MLKVIGIDLGTSNSCVAYIKDGRPEIILDESGRDTTPSIFAISATNEPIVGYPAKDQANTNRLNTIFAVKRLIGRKLASEEIQSAKKKLPYTLLEAENGDAWVEVNGNQMSPEEISAQVLTRMKDIAESYFGEPVRRAVITVPAHFNDSQRQATKDAGRLAGLDVLRIINEPTAAALAFGMNIIDGKDTLKEKIDKTFAQRKNSDRMIAVFDLGGGTFDISILELKDGVFDVKSTNGDTYLGGEDFDMAVVEYLLQEFKSRTGQDVSSDRSVLQRFKDAARNAKHELSNTPKVDVELTFVQGMEHMKIPLDRKKLEELVAPILTRIEYPCMQAMEDAGLIPEDITDVILVGGMTRMPAVKKAAREIFGKEPLDTIDPDHAVALGAAVQAGLLQGFVKGVSLLDVTSLSLGIEIQGAKMHTIIPRNTTIPTKKTEIITTSAPNQPQVSIHVLQGESDFAPDNKTLARFELKGVRPAPRGIPDIAVSFEVDAEGIVHVSAKDLDTGEEQKIEIVAASGLSDFEIDKLLRDRLILEEQKKRMLERSGTDSTISDDETGALAEKKHALKTFLFMTQVKLNTEAKDFKGRGRALLEDALSTARKVLETAQTEEPLDKALLELKKRSTAMEDYLQTLW
ncbi:MAG TPA: molecular chaperone DnaK [Oligoflexia bacterium]|nr:molecular chaperone DnaK [Oligoflexia bacterium]HMP48420.1 molecular chaperone DnaK [Oligoflexia bacterium]